MGMLYELQLKFGMQGTDDIDRWFSKMKTGVSGVSNEVNSHVPKAEQHLERLATAAEKMSQRFSRAMTLAKTAGAAFLAGKALSGVAGLVGQNPEAAEWSDYNKLYGTNQREFREDFKRLRRTTTGVDSAGYGKVLFDTSPLGDNPELRKRAIHSTYDMKKVLGPGSTVERASDMMRTITGGFASEMTPTDETALMERLPGQIRATLLGTKAKGEFLNIAIPHVSGLYAAMGKSTSEMLTDTGIMAEATKERAGEILANVMATKGKGFGEFWAGIDKAMILERGIRGKHDEADLDKDEKRALHETVEKTSTRWAATGTKLLARDPERYWKVLNEGVKEARALGEKGLLDEAHLYSKAFGQTAFQGVPKLAGAHASGKWETLKQGIDASDPLKTRHEIHESEQSLSARGIIFQQRAEDAWTSVKSTFWGALADQYDAYGGFFDKISDLWDKHSNKMSTNIRSFVSGFSAAFGEAFGGLPDIFGKVDQLVEKLKGGDTPFWKDLGKELGQIAATDIKPVVEGFRALGDLLVVMTPMLNAMAKILGFLKDTGEWGAKMQLKHAPTWLGGDDTEDQLKAYEELKKSNKSVMDPIQPHGLFAPAIPRSTTPQNVARPRDILDGMLQNQQIEAKLNARGAEPPSEPTTNNEFSIELDGEQLVFKLIPRLQQKLQDDRDRSGRTAGSGFR